MSEGEEDPAGGTPRDDGIEEGDDASEDGNVLEAGEDGKEGQEGGSGGNVDGESGEGGEEGGHREGQGGADYEEEGGGEGGEDGDVMEEGKRWDAPEVGEGAEEDGGVEEGDGEGGGQGGGEDDSLDLDPDDPDVAGERAGEDEEGEILRAQSEEMERAMERVETETKREREQEEEENETVMTRVEAEGAGAASSMHSQRFASWMPPPSEHPDEVGVHGSAEEGEGEEGEGAVIEDEMVRSALAWLSVPPRPVLDVTRRGVSASSSRRDSARSRLGDRGATPREIVEGLLEVRLHTPHGSCRLPLGEAPSRAVGERGKCPLSPFATST